MCAENKLQGMSQRGYEPNATKNYPKIIQMPNIACEKSGWSADCIHACVACHLRSRDISDLNKLLQCSHFVMIKYDSEPYTLTTKIPLKSKPNRNYSHKTQVFPLDQHHAVLRIESKSKNENWIRRTCAAYRHNLIDAAAIDINRFGSCSKHFYS